MEHRNELNASGRRNIYRNFQTILLGKNRVERMLIPIFQDHNNKMKKLTGKKHAASTLQRFEVALNYIQNF